MEAKPTTLGELQKQPRYAPGAPARTVKDEMRENVLQRLAAGEALFPGVHGYEETVFPQCAIRMGIFSSGTFNLRLRCSNMN